MRKHILIGLSLIAAVSSVFGADVSPGSVPYTLCGEVFGPTSARVTGMGGAGLGMTGYSDAFLYNPAALGESHFRLSVPTFSVTVFNPRKINDTDFFDDVKDADWVNAADNLMSTLTYGMNELERVDLGINGQFGHVGVSLNTRERMLANLNTSSYVDGEYILEDTTALTVGFGYRFPLFSDQFSLDIGANAQFLYQLYTQAIDKTTIDAFIDDQSDPTFPLVAGWALPFAAGANLNLPLGFRASGVVRNLNGKFRYQLFSEAKDFDFGESLKGEDLSYDAGVRFDAGVMWSSPFPMLNKLFHPTLSVDVLDVARISDKEDLLGNLYAGAQVTLFNFLDVRCGLAQGYQSVGIGLDVLVFHIDASYWRREYGENYLDKSIDALTLRFQLLTR